jgi:hypothetical protein
VESKDAEERGAPDDMAEWSLRETKSEKRIRINNRMSRAHEVL